MGGVELALLAGQIVYQDMKLAEAILACMHSRGGIDA